MPATSEVVYPVVPRSATALRVGQFWAVPLQSGRYACGRVLDLPSAGAGGRMEFLAGLLDWIDDDAPTSGTIAGAGVLTFGRAHIKTIRETGGALIGYRPLEADGIEPPTAKDANETARVIYHGLTPVRAATAADAALPVLTTWGYLFIKRLAELHLDQPR